MSQVVVKMIEHGAGLLGKEQNRGKLARSEVRWIKQMHLQSIYDHPGNE